MTTPSGIHPKLTPLLEQISSRSLELQALDRYYTGQQGISFIAPEVARELHGRLKTLVINWCRLVVNSVEERLDVSGFRLGADESPNADLWEIWQANDLDEYSQMCHLDSMVHRIAYAIVWKDPDNDRIPKITVESAEQMTVDFEPGSMRVTAAAKHWSEDDMQYATLYLDDCIYKYAAAAPHAGSLPQQADWSLREDPIPHDLGVVPVVPFINKPRLTNPHGESELTDVIPLVDAICKLATDMMVSAEFHAMIRRWMTGVDMGAGEGSESRTTALLRQRYTNAAAGGVWAVEDENARFGQFQEADLKNFVNGIEMLAAQLAAIAGLPPHYVGLMSQANPASADAIRSAEASLVKRVDRKMRVFGGGWERVMRLALLVRDGKADPVSASMETIWKDPKTESLAQTVDAAVKLDGINMPFRQTLETLGMTPTQVGRVLTMRTDDAVSDVLVLLKAADAIVEEFGISRAAALSAVGLQEAAKVEATVEARAPGPGVVNNEELAAEVKAATPVVLPDGSVTPSRAAIAPPAAPAA